jgi:hypothetical protein
MREGWIQTIAAKCTENATAKAAGENIYGTE